MVDIYSTARSMIADLIAKRVSAAELLEAHVARNAVIASAINAVTGMDLERARRDAAAIDAARSRGDALGPLAGLPMTIKDGFDVDGMPATSGSPAFAKRDKRCADAAMVAAVRKAGAVVWGKTNVPLMLADTQSYNDIYGTTNNPYDVTRVPGGSSGGAAAALACGVTPLEIGSDIGGSLRHPSHFCGTTALKPTWGVLDVRGHIPPPPGVVIETDLMVVGPMARNVDDLKLLWSVLRGTPEQPRRGVAGARVAVWDDEPGWPLAREVKDGVERAASALAAAGASVEHAVPPIDGTALIEPYLLTLTAIVGSSLPEQMLEAFAANRAADKKTVAEGGPGALNAAFRLFATASFREVLIAQARRQGQKDRLAAFFQRYDAIVTPVAMVPAFPHVHEPAYNDRVLEVDGATVPYPLLLNWIALASSLHAPALSVQTGQTSAGLPVGVQIVGPRHGEDRLFDFAAAVEEGTGGFRRPPRLPV